MKLSDIKKTIAQAFVIASFSAATVASADIKCKLDHASRVAYDLTVIENVDHSEFNTVIKQEGWGQKALWLGKMTEENLEFDKLGGFAKKKTVDLAENGELTLVYPKSRPIGKIPCGRASCDESVFHLKPIKGYFKNQTQTLNLNCHEIYGL